MNLNKILNKVNQYPSDYVVYRFVDVHNHVIYVGRTYGLYGRMKSHKDLRTDENYYNIEKIEFIEVTSYEESKRVEAHFIAKYRPKYNKNGINSIFIENKDLDNLVWRLYSYYPRKEIYEEINSLYNWSDEGITIEFNLASIWIMINYCNVFLENWRYLRLGASKISDSVEEEIHDSMYNIYHSLRIKIIYKMNRKYKYIKVREIHIHDHPKTMEIMFRERSLPVYLETYDIYGFYLDTVIISINIKDIKN
ncbi:GIY-YIG nuclease family protein [Terrisporobacter petrolearius]|uniref:GIY-YIG nuclease family protein n=1 Tax=Terrisporobacter petrolearius TaxID=1460447 RepID=UPI0031CC968F